MGLAAPSVHDVNVDGNRRITVVGGEAAMVCHVLWMVAWLALSFGQAGGMHTGIIYVGQACRREALWKVWASEASSATHGTCSIRVSRACPPEW